MTIYLSQLLKNKQISHVIVSRGYKKNLSGTIVVSDQNSILVTSPKQCGDEPFLMANRLPNTPIVVGDDKKNAIQTQNRAIEFSLLLAIPASISIFIIADPIIGAFFERGQFSINDRIMSARALQAFAAGVPAYVLVKILTPIFFARQNTKTPVKIAIVCVFVNFLFNLILMHFFQHVGIAMATAIASWLNCILPLYVLLKSKEVIFDNLIKKNFKKIILLNLFFGLCVFYFKDYINLFTNYRFLNLLIFVLLSISFYTLLLSFLKIFIFSNYKLIKLR